jgi:hypothetical protein
MAQGLKFLVGAFIISICMIIPAVSHADSETDALHFGLSAVFGAATESYFHYKTKAGTAERIIYGTVLGSLPGLGKEIADGSQEDNHFSGRSYAIDVAGAFVGAVLANLVNESIRVSADVEQKKVSMSVTFAF